MSGPMTSPIEIESFAETTRQGHMLKQRNAEDHTVAGGGLTETVTSAIPAGAIVMGVLVYVDTVIVGPADWSVGVAGDTDRYGTGLALTAGTASTSANFASDMTPRCYPTATDIVLTSSAGNWTSGGIHVEVIYYTVTALSAAS